jgi:hypothetical protein
MLYWSYLTMTMPPNHQRIGIDRSAGVTWPGLRGWTRGASNPSVVEPARRRFVKTFSYAFCFFRRPLASSTYADFPHLGQSCRGLPPSGNRAMMTEHNHAVQPDTAATWQISGSHPQPESGNLRKVRREAAGFNKALEPTADGAVRSAIAVHVASRRWLSFFR